MKYLAFAKRAHNQIKKWLELGNLNCRHFAALLDAESSITNHERQLKIVRHFDEAVAFALKDGLLHLQAHTFE